MKESGGLKKMVALITDQAPPEEETKKSDKKGGSRAGKKSAKGCELFCIHFMLYCNSQNILKWQFSNCFPFRL